MPFQPLDALHGGAQLLDVRPPTTPSAASPPSSSSASKAELWRWQSDPTNIAMENGNLMGFNGALIYTLDGCEILPLIGGKHPMIYRVSTCFNHPFGGAGFRWPIHSMFTTFRPSDGARPHPTATSWSCHAPFWWPHPSRHWPSATKGGGKLGPESYWRWGKNPCQWIGLRENLNRRPSIFHDFPMKYGAFL